MNSETKKLINDILIVLRIYEISERQNICLMGSQTRDKEMLQHMALAMWCKKQSASIFALRTCQTKRREWNKVVLFYIIGMKQGGGTAVSAYGYAQIYLIHCIFLNLNKNNYIVKSQIVVL